MGSNKRFTVPSSLKAIYEKVPVQYQYECPSGTNKRSRSKQVGIGYGQKYDFTEYEKKLAEPTPAPSRYNSHIKNSIAYKSNKLPKGENGFYHPYESYEKICHPGMEHAFYLKESPGVGSYLKDQETVNHSMLKNSSRFKFPKNDRKLLQLGDQVTPGPAQYNNDTIITKLREARTKLGCSPFRSRLASRST